MKNSYAKRVDSNQPEIVEGLRKLPGVSVAIVSMVGNLFDIIVGYSGKNFNIELKTEGGKLRPSQVKFMREWNGQIDCCRSLEEVLDVIGYKESP